MTYLKSVFVTVSATIAVCSTTLTNAQPGIDPDVRNLAPKTHTCALDSASDLSGHEPRFEWGDPRLNERTGRIEIIREAFRNVCKYLEDCGADVAVRLICSELRQSPEKGYHDYLREGDVRWKYVASLGLKVNYVQVQRKPNTAARSTVSGKQLTYENGDYLDRAISGNRRRSRLAPEKNDLFRAAIEIFPAVFERREFYMNGEEHSPEGPWARSAVEALEYIILHELGHVEAYVTEHSRANFLRVEDSEEAADLFASSVWRCDDNE